MPSSAWDRPPVTAHEGPGDERDASVPELLDIVPRNPRRSYDMARVIEVVTDPGSWFEVQPRFGASLLTGLARVGGQPVAVVANQPTVLAGTIDCDAAVYPCNLVLSDPQWVMGNLRKETLADIWFSKKWLFFRGGVRISDLPKCRSCNDLTTCRDVYCRLLPYVSANDAFAPHPTCG